MIAIVLFLKLLAPGAESLRATAPAYLTVASAAENLIGARAAASPAVGADTLLAMAYLESRYDARTVSRVSGHRFCGVTQAEAGASVALCSDLASPAVAYRHTAEELRRWLRYTHGDLPRALAGYGCGVAGVESGCRGYAARVLARAALVRRALDRAVRS